MLGEDDARRRARVHRVDELGCARAAAQQQAGAEARVEHAVAIAVDDGEDVGEPSVVVERRQRLGQARCEQGIALGVHVADLDARERAEGRRGRERATGIVGVEMRAHELAVADDDEAVAERREAALEELARERAGDQEAGAVARPVVVGGDRLVHGRDDRGDLGDGIPAQRGERAADELDEPGPSGIDDAGRM